MTEIGISRIVLSGWNPRKSFEPEAFEELKKSIQEYGILEPLIVRPVPQRPEAGYELVAGERRFRAAQELGLKTVPVVVKNLSDRDVREVMLIENLQRSQLEPLEEAGALEVLLQDDAITQEDLGKKLGKSQSWIANRLRLLKAPDELKEMIISRQITPKHAVTLLPYVEYSIFKEVILPDLKRNVQKGEQVSVSQLETIIGAHIRYHADELVLPLHDFPYGVDQYRNFFDFSECDGCKDIYTSPVVKEDVDEDDPDFDPDDKQEPERFCLNRLCWSDKLNSAKQKYEMAHAEKVKTMDGDNTIDIRTLEYYEYERIGKWSNWNKNECQACKNKKTSLDDEGTAFICLDPACAKGKEAAHRKEELKRIREEAQQAITELDTWIDTKLTLSDVEVRGVIKVLMCHLWGEAINAGLKPWTPKGSKWNVAEVDKIPDDDIVKALLRLVCMQELMVDKYHSINKKSVEKLIAIIDGKPLPKEG